MSTYSFNPIIKYVVDGNCLDMSSSYEVARKMLNNELNDIEIAALLTALRVKGECSSEIIGFTKVLREYCIKVDVNYPCIDTAGTGGDGFGTINISTISAIITAAAGAYVLKHGNKAVSSSSGSADFMETIGYNIYHNSGQVKKMMEKTRFAFAYAPQYHPLMRNIMHIRKKLGFKTIFNLVGPLSNPGNVKFQVLGVSKSRYLETMANACRALGYKHVILVHGDPGIDEVSAFGKTKIVEVLGSKIESYEVHVSDFKLPTFSIKDVVVNSPSSSVERIINAVKLGSKLDAVKVFIVLNTAYAMYVANVVKDVLDGVEYSLKLINDGAVINYINYVVKMSREV